MGGETIELVGDLGAGKTTLVRGLGQGLGVDEDVQSPSFTISRSYQTPSGIELIHYDFYRLRDPGVMAADLREATDRPDAIVVIEWADIVHALLPKDHITIGIRLISESERQLTLSIPSDQHHLFEGLL